MANDWRAAAKARCEAAWTDLRFDAPSAQTDMRRALVELDEKDAEIQKLKARIAVLESGSA